MEKQENHTERSTSQDQTYGGGGLRREYEEEGRKPSVLSRLIPYTLLGLVVLTVIAVLVAFASKI